MIWKLPAPLFFVFFAVALFTGTPVHAQGTVDWYDMSVTAVGIGVAPVSAKTAEQSRALARRAAEVVARRNLLEAVKGVHIDSNTTVRNYMVTDDHVISRIKGILKNAVITGYRELQDGTVEATARVPLTGQLSQTLLPDTKPGPHGIRPPARMPAESEQRLRQLEATVTRMEANVRALDSVTKAQQQKLLVLQQVVDAWQRNATSPKDDISQVVILRETISAQQERIAALESNLSVLTNQMATQGSINDSIEAPAVKAPLPTAIPQYTGLIVDATGAVFQPCLRPELWGETLLYPGEYVSPDTAVSHGYVRYYRKLHQAQVGSLAGDVPLTLTASATHDGSGTLQLSPEDADILRAVLQAPDNFLSKCRVAIVF